MTKPTKTNKAALLQTTRKYKMNKDQTIAVSIATLDDIIRNARKFVDGQRNNLVPGHALYSGAEATLKGYLQSAVSVTTQLINDNILQEDKYNVLSCKTKSFGTKNSLANELLREIKEELKEDAAMASEATGEDSAPFNPDQVANIQSEPVKDDADTHIVDETTNDGGRMEFDKVNFQIRVHLLDGNIRIIDLTPDGSWRQTIARWLVMFFDMVAASGRKIKRAFSNGLSTVTGWFKKKEQPAVQAPAAKTTAEQVEAAAEKVAESKPENTAKDKTPKQPVTVEGQATEVKDTAETA